MKRLKQGKGFKVEGRWKERFLYKLRKNLRKKIKRKLKRNGKLKKIIVKRKFFFCWYVR